MENFIFITKKGTKIYRKNNLLYIENKSEAFKESLPFNHFSAIIAFTKLDISTSTINFITSKNKSIFLLNKFGKINSLIVPEYFSSNSKNRIIQYSLANSEENSLKIAQHIIMIKTQNIIKYIKIWYSNSEIPFTQLIKEKEDTFYSKIFSAKNTQELLGAEGYISKHMFAAFIIGLAPEFKFKTRAYYPPPDPVNALLSLTYSLFYNYLYVYTLNNGFDPYIGFLHKRRGKHAVFVSDLMEIYRPNLTFWVKYLFKKEYFTLNDFEYNNKYNWFLKYASLRHYLKLFTEKYILNSEKEIHKDAFAFFNVLKKYKKEGKIDGIFVHI
jgi:CRISPR-associated protein Cas1